jgi:hypothetical protein
MAGKKKRRNNMNLIQKAVKELVNILDDCGIAESPVILTPDYDLPKCEYERGVSIKVIFGGRSAVFVSNETRNVTTKASFMAQAPLKKESQKEAAGGIINAAMGFLCKVRRLHACKSEEHVSCRNALTERISGKRIFCLGDMTDIRHMAGTMLTDDPNTADYILISGDGLVSDILPDIDSYPHEKILCIGPSTAGTAALLHYDHFCPFGRANLQTIEE